MIDLFCVSGTSPTGVWQTECPAKDAQHECFVPSNFYAVPPKA